MASFDTFTDDFNDNSIDSGKWTLQETGGGTVAETNQRIEATLPSNVTSTAGLWSVSAYDLRNSQVHVEIIQVPNALCTLAVYDFADANKQFYFEYFGGTLKMYRDSNSLLGSLTYNSANHKWWRISATSATTERHDVTQGDGAGDYGGFFGDKIANIGSATIGYSPSNNSRYAAAAYKPDGTITFVSKASKGFDAASTTLAINCTGANFLVVAVTSDGEAPTAVTYDGIAMTLDASHTSGKRVYLYHLANPSTGSNNISVTMSDDEDSGIMAVAYNNVDTADPLGNTAAGTGATTSSITITEDGELVVAAFADDEDDPNTRTPSGARVSFSTSPDNVAWTEQASYSDSRSLDNYGAVIYGSNSPQPGTTNFYFDNFNTEVYKPSVTLAGNSSMTLVAIAFYFPSITITGTSAVQAYGFQRTDQSATVKSYLYKVYDTSDNFLGIWRDVVSDLNFSQEINSPGSAIQVELGRNSDTKIINLEDIHTQGGEEITTQDGDTLIAAAESSNTIGPGSDVDINHRVEIWVFYGTQESLETTSGELILTDDNQEIILNIGAVNGKRKFHGYITRYVSRYGSTESVIVSIASFGRELDNYVLKDGSDTTVTYNSTAPNAIVTDALDKFNAQGGIVSYASGTVDATGTTVSYTFRLNTFLEVLKKCLELAPFDWYFYVGLGDDTVYFKQKPTTPSHYFVLGKHIESLDLEYNIEDITNLVYVVGDETAGVALFKVYTDATSITNYRQGLKRITDHRLTLDASADLIGEAEIDRNDTPRYRSSITILDNTYEIEAITLGQLVGFRNFGNYIDDVEMQIVGIDYEPDRVVLQLDALLPSVNKRIEDLRRALVETDSSNIPDAPT